MLGVALALTTGVLLLSAKPAEYAGNAVVWAKFAVIALALLNALRFEIRWRRHGASLLGGDARLSALLSATLWLAAILLGRWIAFV